MNEENDYIGFANRFQRFNIMMSRPSGDPNDPDWLFVCDRCMEAIELSSDYEVSVTGQITHIVCPSAAPTTEAPECQCSSFDLLNSGHKKGCSYRNK